jgi:hypothetical protein
MKPIIPAPALPAQMHVKSGDQRSQASPKSTKAVAPLLWNRRFDKWSSRAAILFYVVLPELVPLCALKNPSPMAPVVQVARKDKSDFQERALAHFEVRR